MTQLTTVADKIANVRGMLSKRKGDIASLLPDHMKARIDKVLAAALFCVRANPSLADCEPVSFLQCVFTLARQGLMPAPTRGDAYLVPFRVKNRLVCQTLLDYRGSLRLVRNSGEISSVSAGAVREGDTFDYRFGSRQFVDHKYGDQRGTLTHAWCVIKTKDSGEYIAVLTADQVMKRKAASRSSGRSDSPWVLWEDDMWMKSAVHACVKLAPQSDELMSAFENDARAEAGKPQLFDAEILGEEREAPEPEQPEATTPEAESTAGSNYDQPVYRVLSIERRDRGERRWWSIQLEKGDTKITVTTLSESVVSEAQRILDGNGFAACEIKENPKDGKVYFNLESIEEWVPY